MTTSEEPREGGSLPEASRREQRKASQPESAPESAPQPAAESEPAVEPSPPVSSAFPPSAYRGSPFAAGVYQGVADSVAGERSKVITEDKKERKVWVFLSPQPSLSAACWVARRWGFCNLEPVFSWIGHSRSNIARHHHGECTTSSQ